MLRILCCVVLASTLILPAPLVPGSHVGASVVSAAPDEDRGGNRGEGNRTSQSRPAEPAPSSNSNDSQQRMAEVQKALDAARAQEAAQQAAQQRVQEAQQRAQEAQQRAQEAQRAQAEAQQRAQAEAQQRAQEAAQQHAREQQAQLKAQAEAQRAQEAEHRRQVEAAQQRAQEEAQQRQAAQQRAQELAQQQIREGEQRLAEQRQAAAAQLKAQEEAQRAAQQRAEQAQREATAAQAQQRAQEEAEQRRQAEQQRRAFEAVQAAQQAAQQQPQGQSPQQARQEAELRAQQQLQEQVRQLAQQQQAQRQQAQQQAQQSTEPPAAQLQSAKEGRPAPAEQTSRGGTEPNRAVEPAQRVPQSAQPQLSAPRGPAIVPAQNPPAAPTPSQQEVTTGKVPQGPTELQGAAACQAAAANGLASANCAGPAAPAPVVAPQANRGAQRAAQPVVAPAAAPAAPAQGGIQALLSAATSIFQPAQPPSVHATAQGYPINTIPAPTYLSNNGPISSSATTFDPYARTSAAAVSPGFTNPYPYPFSYGPYPPPNTNPVFATPVPPGYSYPAASFFTGGNPYAPSYPPPPPINAYVPGYDPFGPGYVSAYALPVNVAPAVAGVPYDLYGSGFPYASVYINGVYYKPWEIPAQLGYGSNYYNPYAGGTVRVAGSRSLAPIVPFGGPGYGASLYGTYGPQYRDGIWHQPWEAPSAYGYSGMSPYSAAPAAPGYGLPAGGFPFGSGYFPFVPGGDSVAPYAGMNYSYGVNPSYPAVGAYGTTGTVQAYSDQSFGNPAAYVASLVGLGAQPAGIGLPTVALRLTAPMQPPPGPFGLPAGAQIPGLGNLRVPSVNALRPSLLGLNQLQLPSLFGNRNARPGVSAAGASAQVSPSSGFRPEVGAAGAGLGVPAATNAGRLPVAEPGMAPVAPALPSASFVDSDVPFGAVPAQSQILNEASASLVPVDALAIAAGPGGAPALGGPRIVQVAATAQEFAFAAADPASLLEAAPVLVASAMEMPAETQLEQAASIAGAVAPAVAGAAQAALPASGVAAAAPVAATSGTSFGAVLVSILAVLVGMGLWAFSFFGLRRR